MFWCPNSEVLKISNVGRGRWLGQNDHLFRPWLKERRYYFCKDLIYGHDLHLNRMWKWLFWRSNNETLKTKNFGSGRSVRQKNHYFRSYMRQETLINQYELLYAYALWNKRMVKWSSWFINCETLSNWNCGCGRLPF